MCEGGGAIKGPVCTRGEQNIPVSTLGLAKAHGARKIGMGGRQRLPYSSDNILLMGLNHPPSPIVEVGFTINPIRCFGLWPISACRTSTD